LDTPTGEKITSNHEYETTLDDAERQQILAAAAQSFIATIEFYKSEPGVQKLTMRLSRKL
jgi:hypothetical protein